MLRWKHLPWGENQSPKSRIVALRLNSLADPYFFGKVVLGQYRMVQHLHGSWLDRLSDPNLHLVLEAPRDHFKSTAGTFVLPMWWALPFERREEDWMSAELEHQGQSSEQIEAWIRYMKRIHSRDLRIIIAIETEPNAVKMGYRFDTAYEKNMLFREVFSDILPETGAVWNQLIKTHKRNKQSSGEGTYNFVGVGTALQSNHMDRAIQDDLFGENALYSQSEKDRTIEWHQKLPGCFDTDMETETGMNLELVIGNRWCIGDLNDHIKKNNPLFRFETHSAEGGCCSKHAPGQPIFPEEFSPDRLNALKVRFGARFYCTPAESPILMANWSEKPISEVVDGDMVMGYVKEKNRWVMKPSKVLKKHSVGVRPVIQGETVDGRIFRCTPDHKWFTGRSKSDGHKPYLPSKVGRKMIFVYDPPGKVNAEHQRLYDWLGGMFDGEGSCIGSPSLSQSSRNSEVCAEIERVLTALQIDYRIMDYPSTRAGWSDKRNYVLNGGRSLKIKLLRHCHMVKSQRFADSMWKESRRLATRNGYGRINSKVRSIVPIGEELVFGLTTETGNYIAWGFASQNSAHYLNNPISEETCDFRKDWLRRYRTYRKDVGVKSDGTALQQTWIEILPRGRDEVEEDFPVADLERLLILDPNHGGEKGRARHAAIVVGWRKKQGRKEIYLLESWAKAVSHESMKGHVADMASRWHVQKFFVEVIAGQDGWLAFFEQTLREKIGGCLVQGLPKERGAGAKERRILSMSPLYERGQVFVRMTGSEDFVQEFEYYPNGTTVDLLDCMGYLFNIVETQTVDVGRWQYQVNRDMELRRRSVGKAGY